MGNASAMAAQRQRTLLDSLVPAPPKFSIVYDNPTNAGGVDPATGQPYPSVGQYADPATNTVHTTRGYSRRLIAQDLGQLVGYNVLGDGDRHYFSRLLGTDPSAWSSGVGAQPGRLGGGDEAFANYYSVAATGGLKPRESLAVGDTSIDPGVLRQFTVAMGRLGKRRHLEPLNLTEALASAH
jgi:hypothetical protein